METENLPSPTEGVISDINSDEVFESLSNLSDDELNNYYIFRPTLKNFVRLQFDPYKLYRHGINSTKN